MAAPEILLLYFAMPLWFVAGFADWLCHRHAHLPETAGPFESVLHLLMFAEAGLALLIGLFFEVNSLVFLMLIAIFLIHEATALWDVRYATAHRKVTYWEQHVHSFLEIVPLLALTLLASIHWSQVRALFTLSSEASWSLQWKHQPLPLPFVIGVIAASIFVELVPYIQELWTGIRARRPPATQRAATAIRNG
jgi:uncharacterized membrane protein YphA (DoxX/SURF4 family)